MRIIALILPLAATSMWAADEVSIPSSSWTSPVCIQGFSDADSFPIVNGTIPTDLGYGHWYKDVTLLPFQESPIEVTGAQSTITNVRWTIIDLGALPITNLDVRVGDSILVSSPTGTFEVNGPNGKVALNFSENSPYPVTFAAPGPYTIAFGYNILELRAVGVPDGSDLIANSAKDTRALALQVRQPWDPALVDPNPLLPVDAPVVFGTYAPSSILEVSQPSLDSIAFKVRAKGSNLVWARLGDIQGPVIGFIKVMPFQIDISASPTQAPNGPKPLPDVIIVVPSGDDSLANTYETTYRRLTVTPYIPDLIVTTDTFAHPSTFADGSNHMDIPTDGSPLPTGEPGMTATIPEGGTEAVGILDFIVMSNRQNDSTCLSTMVAQKLPISVIQNPSN